MRAIPTSRFAVVDGGVQHGGRVDDGPRSESADRIAAGDESR